MTQVYKFQEMLSQCVDIEGRKMEKKRQEWYVNDPTTLICSLFPNKHEKWQNQCFIPIFHVYIWTA